jgi:uncharacterized protein YfcZ (UPF0381/DUF406 family)
MKSEAQKLLNRMFRLQADIYDLQSIMEDRNRTKEAELIGASGFELDEAMNKLKDAINSL